ncbi:ATPase component of ABC-type sugar transporter [Synechococcus sp. PCC 7502]|uniref:ABC transporter ATP-binding protein n=1 Tax=Synechococcus sp. PCC 7502 TaxID=1173263 RepID=UPI00029FA677|nr:ABC transporter ATP-binding protein [Synechococcus sp. PCC 7502]AFY75217.1 ATPase component of ABC-type sugar transporter [Synechococcus sp. PCC 7502]
MASVRLSGVSKTFGSTQVLRDIDLTIADREFMVLVGPSGCGKSTLLRLIAGLEALSAGAIYLGDRQIDQLPPKSRDMAMVFQSYALYPHMSVFNNIAFGLRRQDSNFLKQRFNRAYNQAIFDRVEQVAKSLQIQNLLHRKPAELSGGQKQRVALGRAIARNPQVFLMDEPLSNLDAQLRSETRSQLVQLQNELQTTTIYVTHDQTEAMTMGSRIVVLKSGKIQQVDTPINIYRHPNNIFVAGFIGSPSMNFLPVVAEDNSLKGQYLNTSLPWRTSHQIPSEQHLILGFRPEHIQPASSASAHLSGRVKLIESLGSETNVIVDIQGLLINAKTSPDLAFSIGELTHWQLDLQKFHVFDGESEMRLPELR